MITAMASRHLRELVDCDRRLQLVLCDVADAWPEDKVMRVSSIYRTEEENKAAGAKTRMHVVGPPYRSIDLGGKELGKDVDSRWYFVKRLADKINSMWRYDPQRPTKSVAYAKPHGTAPHIHLQVHPRTRRITTEEV